MKATTEDVIIVEELRNNSPNGNKLLFDKYYGALKKYLINNFDVDTDTSEDIVSGALLNVFDKIEQFSFKDNNSFRNWVYQIAKNKYIDYKRNEKGNGESSITPEKYDIDEISKELRIKNCGINKTILDDYLSSGILEDKRKTLIYEAIEEFGIEEQYDLWAYFKGVSHIDSAKYRKMSYEAYRKRISRLSIEFFNKIGKKLKIDGKIYNEKYKKSI